MFSFLSIRNVKNENKKAKSPVYAVFCFFWFGVIQLQKKTSKESNNPLLVFQSVIIGKHKWDLYPPVVLAFCVLHIKHLTKAKNNHVIHASFSALRVIRKQESPPVNMSFTA